ncbi:hypothetical protein L6452_36425 [Arctium lappa]|uniref:Uncharacterized protein n=1 Tax=Arctium lappa TaxID=4217 RepID=A0ACB8YDC6_ARCLA|nr:hypothetical protein L6452_36425 [Arctium lappa]
MYALMAIWGQPASLDDSPHPRHHLMMIAQRAPESPPPPRCRSIRMNMLLSCCAPLTPPHPVSEAPYKACPGFGGGEDDSRRLWHLP